MIHLRFRFQWDLHLESNGQKIIPKLDYVEAKEMLNRLLPPSP